MQDDELIEAMARSIDPQAWADDLPIPARAHTIAFHEGRMKSAAQARAALAAYRTTRPAVSEDDAELVKRLGEGTTGTDIGKTDPYLNALMRQAATRIEALSRENVRLYSLAKANNDLAKLQAVEIDRYRRAVTFDPSIVDGLEFKLVEWANKISGPKGGKPYHPDPVGVAEMCEDVIATAICNLTGEKVG